MPDNKYKTQITVRDEQTFINAQGAHYLPDEDEIRIKKGKIKWSDFGLENAPEDGVEELILVHERQHQINARKGVHNSIVSLDENYQRDVHDEVTALIAENLEIRRQYQACKTDKEREAFFKKFANCPANAEYLNAIKTGKVNPNSTSQEDFKKEMAFIKDSAIRYRADPNDSAYRTTWLKNTFAYLAQHGSSIKSNPEAFKKDVHDMYIIGGFDFNTVGQKDLHVIDNQTVQTADRLLAQGGDVNKIKRLINYNADNAFSDGSFKLAESLDVSGLSKEQAQQVIQTAFISQNLAQDVAGDLILGQEPSYDYDFIARSSKEEIALYLDIKEDIWQKNGTLSEQGDEQKFEELMKKAKQIPLDAEGWYQGAKNFIRKDKYDLDEVYKKVQEIKGQIVDFDKVVANADKLKLPLDGTNKDEIIAAIDKKEKEHAEFMEEYYKKHPEELKEPELSDPYKIDITDFESNILKDELETRQKEEQNSNQTIEPLYTPKNLETYAPIGDNLAVQIKNPEFKTAELKTIINDADGSSTEVTLLDGKKHGLEITRDKEGNITGYKVYNHGEEVDANKHAIELNTKTENGLTAVSVTLDDQKFGAEIVSDNNGKTKVAFFEEGGALIQGTAQASYTKTEVHIDDPKLALRQELSAQQGELPNNPQATAQNLRFDMHWSKRTSQDDSKTVADKPSPEKQNTPDFITPVWQKDITD